MRIFTLTLLLLPSLISAATSPSLPAAASTPTAASSNPPPESIPQPPAAAPQSPNPLFPPKLAYPIALFDFIANLQTPLGSVNERQAGIALGGGAGAAPTPVNQVSPVTIVYISGKPIPYTQTFPPIPDQGPTAMSGSIGLGTLTGAVGVVRTDEAKNGGDRAKVKAMKARLEEKEARNTIDTSLKDEGILTDVQSIHSRSFSNINIGEH